MFRRGRDLPGKGTPMNCLVCDAQLPAPASAGRPRRYCSAACRQRAYHARHAAEQPIPPPQAVNERNLEGRLDEPLLAAIVFVPVDGEAAVYTAQSFAEFPWRRLVEELSAARKHPPVDGDGI